MPISADVTRQVLDLSKATFDNTFQTIDAVQRALEEVVLSAADASGWLPAEIKTIAHECVGLARRTRRDIKQTTDRCHRAVHTLVERVLDESSDDAGPTRAPGRRRAADADATVVH